MCLGCGWVLVNDCPVCGARPPIKSSFCNQCGTSLDARRDARLRVETLFNESSLEGERKQVTVLFADLKGSMELLADRDPEEARKLLDPVLEHMMEAVHRYEGTVNQVMGDGIMALFGAPLAHEDHAVRACYAALRMQEAREAVRRRASAASHGVHVQIRVGLNSGEVVVRSIGSDLHMDYTAVGQTTHLAARMEQLADPGTILITARHAARSPRATSQVQAARAQCRSRGWPTPVEVYELIGRRHGRARGCRPAAARGLTPLRRPRRRARAAAPRSRAAAAGQGQVVASWARPGVGKSRLFWEFTHSHRDAGLARPGERRRCPTASARRTCP